VPLSKSFFGCRNHGGNNSFASHEPRPQMNSIVFTGSKKWRDRIYVRENVTVGSSNAQKYCRGWVPRSSARFFHRCALQASKDAGTIVPAAFSLFVMDSISTSARSFKWIHQKAICFWKKREERKDREEIEGLPPLNSASSGVRIGCVAANSSSNDSEQALDLFPNRWSSATQRFRRTTKPSCCFEKNPSCHAPMLLGTPRGQSWSPHLY